MRLFVNALIAAGFIWSGMSQPGIASAGAAQTRTGCEGSWLVRITLADRDVIEDGLVRFGADGDLTLVGPPVVPPLPNNGSDPLYVSDGVGHWQETGASACAFDVVRLLGDAEGNGRGALYWRGAATTDPGGLAISGSFSYAQSTPVGQTIATGSGTLSGTSLGPAVSVPPPSIPVTNLTTYEDAEYGFRLAYDPARWQVQSQSASAIHLSDGVSVVSIGGSRALPTDATACVDSSIEALSVTSARQDYAPLRDTAGNPLRRDGPLAAFAIFTFRDRSGGERFERVECRTLPDGQGVVTILHNGALADAQTSTANLETLLNGLALE